MAKLTCPNCGHVLAGLANAFYCAVCDKTWDDDDVMPPVSLHQRRKSDAHAIPWHKPQVADTQPVRVVWRETEEGD